MEGSNLERKRQDAKNLIFFQGDNPQDEQIDNPVEKADLLLEQNDENIQIKVAPPNGTRGLKRFVSLFSVALGQILIYLGVSGNSKFYIFLAIISVGSILLRNTVASRVEILLFTPLLILTGINAWKVIPRHQIQVLEEREVRNLGIKYRDGRSYLCGDAEVTDLNRGHEIGSKQVLLNFSGSRIQISMPDLPWPDSNQVVKGAKIHGIFEITLLPPGELPWTYDAHLRRNGIVATGKSISYEILQFANAFDSVEQIISEVTNRIGASDGLDLINASVLGRGELLSKDQDELYKRTSTTHLIVVSGFHVGILSRIAEKLLLGLIRYWPKIFLFISSEILGPVFGLLSATLYGYLIGFSLTVVRALVALTIVSIGKCIFRKASSLSVLAVAFIFVQLIWPGSTFEPGCQLTFAALFGLYLSEICLNGIHYRWFPATALEAQLKGHDWRVKNFFYTKLFVPLFTCFTVGLTVSPVTLIWFEKFVPASPFINAVLIPIFTFFVLIFGGLALLIYKLIGIQFLLKLAIFSAYKVTCLIEWLEKESIYLHIGPMSVTGLGAIELALLHLSALFFIVRYCKQNTANSLGILQEQPLSSNHLSDRYCPDL